MIEDNICFVGIWTNLRRMQYNSLTTVMLYSNNNQPIETNVKSKTGFTSSLTDDVLAWSTLSRDGYSDRYPRPYHGI